MVNAASLFFLSSLISKNEKIAKKYKQKEVTTIQMPPSFIEGFETIILFSLFIVFPKFSFEIWTFFTVAVWINIFH